MTCRLTAPSLTDPKKCTCCKIVKTPAEFGLRKHKHYTSLNSWCKHCTVHESTKGRAAARNQAMQKKRQTQYVDYAGTPSLLGIALGIVPIKHQITGRIIRGAG